MESVVGTVLEFWSCHDTANEFGVVRAVTTDLAGDRVATVEVEEPEWSLRTVRDDAIKTWGTDSGFGVFLAAPWLQTVTGSTNG